MLYYTLLKTFYINFYMTFNHYENYAFRVPNVQESLWVGQLFVVSLLVYSNNHKNVCLMTTTPPIIGIEICSNDKMIWFLVSKFLSLQPSSIPCSTHSTSPQITLPSLFILFWPSDPISRRYI